MSSGKFDTPVLFNRMVSGGLRVAHVSLEYISSSKQESPQLESIGQESSEIGPYEHGLIDQKDGRLAVQLNGKRHLLTGHTSDFRTVPTNTKLPMEFMSRETFERIAEHLSNNGFKEDQISSLREAYKDADAERSLPRVEFDEAGQVQRITRKVGYELSARVHVLTNSSAYDQNIKDFCDDELILARAKLSALDAVTCVEELTRTRAAQLSALDAVTMVAQAAETVSAEQRPALEKFAEKLFSTKSLAPAPAPAGSSGGRLTL